MNLERYNLIYNILLMIILDKNNRNWKIILFNNYLLNFICILYMVLGIEDRLSKDMFLRVL